MAAPTDAGDLLAGARWECTATAPDAASLPGDLAVAATTWWPASVPGTAAGALRAAGAWSPHDARDFDADDWWYRCRLPRGSAPGPTSASEIVLRAEGLATISEVFVGGERVLASDSMFEPTEGRLPASLLGDPAGTEIAIAFRALGPRVEAVRDRPRWRTQLVEHQGLRQYRTTLLGRMPGIADGPAPVGPWRPLTLRAPPQLALAERDLQVRCEGGGGRVELRAVLQPLSQDSRRPPTVVLRVGDAAASLDLEAAGDALVVAGSVSLPSVERWWPHTHGRPVLHQATLELDGACIPLGRIGFRTVELDTSGGAFRLVVNGIPLFTRGACWVPVDPVGLTADGTATRRRLRLATGAGMNLLRIPGTMVYEDAAFFDACDDLGLLVWQDVMLASLDPPAEPGFAHRLAAEVTTVLGDLQGRPSPAVVCGGSEIAQQAAMVGLPADRRSTAPLDGRLADVVATRLPGVPFVASTPCGGEPPFRPDTGVAHYFGVGAYLRPPEDARRAGVRFAAECLAFSVPPEGAVVDGTPGGAAAAGHDPCWKRGVPRNAGCAWDFEDVRDHYVATLFGVDPRALRRSDPERALDLGRAAVTYLTESTLAEWRRPGSTCAGALVLAFADLLPGAGFGMLDVGGRPKASWYAFARAAAPVAVLLTDEGLNGVAVHCCNDTPETVDGVLEIALWGGEHRLAAAERPLRVPPASATTVGAEEVLGEFRDVSYAYRFGPPAHDAVVAAWRDGSGRLLGRAVHLPLGLARPLDGGLAIEADLLPHGADGWVVEVRSNRLAQFVVVEAAGFSPDDSWFHLPPATPHRVRLAAAGAGDRPPAGRVRALNSLTSARFRAVS